jgi:hypothetical protein
MYRMLSLRQFQQFLAIAETATSVLVLVVEEPIMPSQAAAADEGQNPRRLLGWLQPQAATEDEEHYVLAIALP